METLTFPVPGLRGWALVGALLAAFALAIAAAGEGWKWVVVAALAFGFLLELVAARLAPRAVELMRESGLTMPVRLAIASIPLVVLAATCLSTALTVGAAVVAVVVVVSSAALERLQLWVVRVRRVPLRARRLDLGGFRLPPKAPRFAMSPMGTDAVYPLLASVGLAVSAQLGGRLAASVGLVVAGIAAAVAPGWLGVLLARDLRSGLRERAVAATSAAVEKLRPEVVLYFSGVVEELYQLRMWFAPVAKLNRRTLVVVRSDLAMDQLDRVPFPVVSSPYNGMIDALPLPPRVVTLFATHSGNNLSMVRRRETYCVFVGHGDSDKPDSSNPYARLYDEVWVAGPLGRRRYAEAGVGIRDEAIHEVGRPQFVPPDEPPPSPPVIVYAPTWEGWGGDDHHSSLAHAGLALVERLLATAGIRVQYRPHPLTGVRDPVVRRINRQIIERVGRVGEGERIETTFARASALVTDVSSTISEYLPFDRPYALIDTRPLGRRAYTRRFPSSAGGFLLGPDLAGLDRFVAAAQGGSDPSARARRALIADALGDPATSQERFAAAVDRALSA
ncbi:MAG TPA: CDP-glycerol glycerophosphotransferase family protein [Mycobacteriales bacterium]|nr:CDP-glycerol glycerophosphotransferase family protein [Mycobacteriales bacterium]